VNKSGDVTPPHRPTGFDQRRRIPRSRPGLMTVKVALRGHPRGLMYVGDAHRVAFEDADFVCHGWDGARPKNLSPLYRLVKIPLTLHPLTSWESLPCFFPGPGRTYSQYEMWAIPDLNAVFLIDLPTRVAFGKVCAQHWFTDALCLAEAKPVGRSYVSSRKGEVPPMAPSEVGWWTSEAKEWLSGCPKDHKAGWRGNFTGNDPTAWPLITLLGRTRLPSAEVKHCGFGGYVEGSS